MKVEGKLCPNNFQVWVAFLMGMVVIVIAIVVFDKASNGRLGLDNRVLSEQVVDQRIGGLPQDVSATSTTLLASGAEPTPSIWLGIEINNINETMAKQLGLKISEGVLVNRVIAGSPAEKAGVLPGDILFEFDRREIDDVEDLVKLLNKAEAGERVRLSLFRDGERLVIYVELEEAITPQSQLNSQALSINKNGAIVVSDSSSTPDIQQWGLVLSELTDSLRKLYKIPDDINGVVVMVVIPNSAAARAGLVQGDLIRQIDKTQIKTLADFFKALQDADNNVILYVYRENAALLIYMTAQTSNQSQIFSVAQEGIGMNRPLYVPGYDQTQSGEPDDKTQSTLNTSTNNTGTVKNLTDSSFL
ncbi:MAG: PDZ domain-containing protein [Desulfamplus sp.]|nr:PDZ domain-containing protein [Desulfamplus sp.]MBF0388957.1 PDZ domain-containing protein [Desulfamplus sp.]